MDLLILIVKTFAIMGLVSLGMIIVTMAITMFWVRYSVKSKIYAIFLEPNNQITRELIKHNGDEKISSKDGGDYLVIPSKLKWSQWPPGLPSWVQEIVPTLFYVRNKAEPFDPNDNKSAISARSLRYITDEGMLRQTWKEAKEAAGEGKVLGKDLLLWVSGGTLVVAGIVAFMVWQSFSTIASMQSQINELMSIIRGL